MTQTVSGALAVRDQQNQAIRRMTGWQADIAMAAASHIKPGAVIRVAQGALRKNPKLMDAAMANPQSLLYALLDAARLGHEPDTDDYYLVPFGLEVTGIEGYKGIIERMFRAGGVSSVVAEVVRQTDAYRPQGRTTPPVHEYDDFASDEERGPMRGAYAYANLPDGRCSYVVRMGRAEIMKHKAKSRGSDKSDSPWQQWEEAMWKKTVLRALEPYVPTSTEYRNAVPAAALAAGSPHPMSAPASTAAASPGAPESVSQAADIVDAELIPDSGPAERSPQGDVPKPASKAAIDRLQTLLRQVPLGDDPDVDVFRAWVTGHRADEPLTASDVRLLASTLEDALKAAQGDGVEAASQLWQQHKRATQAGSDGN